MDTERSKPLTLAEGRDKEDCQRLVGDTLQRECVEQSEDTVHSSSKAAEELPENDDDDPYIQWYQRTAAPTRHLEDWKIPLPYNRTGYVWHRGLLVSGSQLLDYVRLHGLKNKENPDSVLTEDNYWLDAQRYMRENEIPIVDISTPILNKKDRKGVDLWLLAVYTSEDLAYDEDDNLTAPMVDRDRLRAFQEEFGIAEQEMMGTCRRPSFDG
ncbi:hypothetical protein BV25DRAFT_1231041 [Artomyces pyxidatus]|uniref:Uncharacterized protein n=1 Tax=Artomyces pyxidatus TaxID=48021 RepID=A0ACB8SQS1_9AGAM|nr:hypothetical protein BV25DRAFT_1231041 [Artomyces pyxidatus]